MRPAIFLSSGLGRRRSQRWQRRILVCTGVAALRLFAADEAITVSPLNPRSIAAGSTMFTEMPPEATGIATSNDYRDPRMWGDRYQEFQVGAIGTGVAIGDYDGDGKPDLFVVSKTESCRLFHNLGGWKFADVSEQAGVADHGAAAGIWKQGATFADVNNDGRLDLYVCRFNAPNLLYVNQGDGTFREAAREAGLDVTDGSVMAAFCDYDRDGWLDVFIQTNVLNFNQHPQGQPDYLFHNNRDGTFSNVTRAAGIAGEAQGHSATWWDYDNDGWPDLYVANDFAAGDRLYRNRGDGTFVDVINDVVPHTPYSSMGSDLGDVNNDGLIDLLATDMAATTHEKDQRGMADSRSRTVDEDPASGIAPQYERNALYLNTGTGRVLEAAHLAGLSATDWTWAPRWEDFDNDGRLDLFVTNGMHREATNLDLQARQLVLENAAERMRAMRDSPVLNEVHHAFQNLGNLTFAEVGAAWGLNQRGVAFGAACGDLDGDGDLDLVYGNYQKGVTVFRNDCGTGHRLTVALRGRSSNRFGVGAVVTVESASGTQIRQLVLSRGVLSSSEPRVHFGLGADNRIMRLRVVWPSGQVQNFEDIPVDQAVSVTEPSGAVPTSLPADQRSDRAQFTDVTAEWGMAVPSREDVVDETALQRLVPFRFNRRGPSLAVTSSRNSTGLEIIIGGTTHTPIQRLRRGAEGALRTTVVEPILPPGAVNDGPILQFDANGDGRPDLFITKGGANLPAGSPEYQPTLLLDDGHDHLTSASSNAFPLFPVSVGAGAVVDFDRDAQLDLFLGGRVQPGLYPLSPRSGLFRNNGGHFEDVTQRMAPELQSIGMVTAAVWSDVDNDGWPDLMLTLDWGTLKYFHNRLGTGFEDWSERAGFTAAGTGWWTSLASADFNEDGRPDFVVGNVGLNTQYRASRNEPALLYSGDFNGRGEEPQLIEAYIEGGQIYPWRTRRNLGAVIPTVLKRFPKNNFFARATLAQILGDETLAKAERYAATELQSGVFLSRSDGTYHFSPLPRIAQIAPFQGTVAGDFDGDGHADVYAIQNFFSPIAAIGRFDGGLSQYFRGDGRGNFTPVPAAESGLKVSGDAKALVVVDLNGDGRPDFIASRNQGSTIAFRNEGRSGTHSFRVSLRGARGNVSAIGAQLTLELADGQKQTVEVQAGAGYSSQSEAAVFFGWSDGNPPQHIQVRWPGGEVTRYVVPANSRNLELSASSGN